MSNAHSLTATFTVISYIAINNTNPATWQISPVITISPSVTDIALIGRENV